MFDIFDYVRLYWNWMCVHPPWCNSYSIEITYLPVFDHVSFSTFFVSEKRCNMTGWSKLDVLIPHDNSPDLKSKRLWYVELFAANELWIFIWCYVGAQCYENGFVEYALIISININNQLWPGWQYCLCQKKSALHKTFCNVYISFRWVGCLL